MTVLNVGDRVVRAYLDGLPLSGVCIRSLPTLEDEISEALRRVIRWLEDGVAPGEITLIVRDEHLYLQPLADKAAEYAVPLISGRQQALIQTPLGGLLQLLAAALSCNWEYGPVRALLTHPLLQLPFDVSVRAAALKEVRPNGLIVWDSSLADLEVLPSTDWQNALGRIEKFLMMAGIWETARHEPNVNVALSLVVQHLRPKARDVTECSPSALARFLNNILRTVTLPTLFARSAVRVLNPIGAVGREFSHVVILGLANGIFPMPRRDDPLIDTHTRKRWAEGGVTLPGISELASIEESLFLLAVGTARDELVLSYPKRDLRMQPLLPSPFLEVIAG